MAASNFAISVHVTPREAKTKVWVDYQRYCRCMCVCAEKVRKQCLLTLFFTPTILSCDHRAQLLLDEADKANAASAASAQSAIARNAASIDLGIVLGGRQRSKTSARIASTWQ